MKKEILETLKTKYNGVGDTILSRIAEKLAKTVTTQEEVATAVEGVTFQQVLENYGDSRATEAQQTAVSNYEKKHGLKDGVKKENGVGNEPPKPEEKKPEDKGKKEGSSDEVPAWAQTLINTNLALEKRLANIEVEKTVNTRKSTLLGILKDAPDKIKQRYEKDFTRMNFADEEDFNTWIGEITPDIEELKTEFSTKSAVVGRPKSGNEKTKEGEISPLLKARIAEKEAETAAPAVAGLTTQIK